jgi:hypothetical protein
VRKSKLNIILKIKEERAIESLKTYAKSIWPAIKRQRI